MMIMIILRDKVRHDVSGNIRLVRHGTAHQGPVGQEVSIRLFTCDIMTSLIILTHDLHHQVLTHQFQLTREQAMEWQEDCHGQTKSCMQVTSDILWIAIRSSFLRVQCRRRQSQEGPWGRNVRVSTLCLSCSTVFWSWSLV